MMIYFTANVFGSISTMPPLGKRGEPGNELIGYILVEAISSNLIWSFYGISSALSSIFS
jgi:hypothetical protein